MWHGERRHPTARRVNGREFFVRRYRWDMLKASCLRARYFIPGGVTVIEIHPNEIRGSWERGYVLDVHTISSTMIGYNEFGHPEFDTVRSALGELVYRVKYRGDKGAILSIVEAITGF